MSSYIDADSDPVSPRAKAVPDPYSSINEVPEDVLPSLAHAMEERAKEAEASGLFRKVFKNTLRFCAGAKQELDVLDVGCGTGAVTRAIASLPSVRRVIGLDPQPYFLETARAQSVDCSNIEYYQGCGTNLPSKDESIDVVIITYVLSHLSNETQRCVLNEAWRVVKPGGRILLEDKDLASWSLTYGPTDPLTAAVETMLEAWHQNLHLCRGFPSMLEEAGFEADKLRVHHDLYDEENTYGYNGVLLRAINVHINAGRCTKALGNMMIQEAKERVDEKRFQCLLTYAYCVGHKPAQQAQ
eukprot:TRINITY_DN45604_c0_g1_i1.p1 TRINITY_DN45604_c0_g1~~TRINITY_DN45604_c0_g1_i1.p1  ORF type:complete len:299 (-),score=64.88 TRINITY_DN45604_c0_g1_i1:190-1086(-)